MSNDDDGIIDAEIVEDDHLPAVVTTYQHSEPITKWSEEWWAAASPEVQANRCVAHKKTGERCKNAAILGATVCRFHGGAAKHVKRAARARLENAADLMAQQLLRIATSADSEAVRLNAIRDALDRSGLKAPSEVVLSQGEAAKPYEAVFDSIGGDPETAGFPSAASADYGPAGHPKPPPRPGWDSPGGEEGGSHSDADRYAGYGADSVPPHESTAQYREPSSADAPPRQGRPRDHDGDTRAQPRQSARSQPAPATREVHVTGMAAIRMANEANRASGAIPDQLAIESPHKRYRRP